MQNADEPFFHRMLGGKFPSGFFFIDVGGRQVEEALHLFGFRDQGCCHDLLRDLSNIKLEVLTPDLVPREKLVHAVRVIELHKSPFENQAIESLQDTGDQRSKALQKGLHGYASVRKRKW